MLNSGGDIKHFHYSVYANMAKPEHKKTYPRVMKFRILVDCP